MLMNEFLKHTGLAIIPAPQKTTSARKLYVINNPDGSARWIWTANTKRADFLKFYTVTSLRSKLFSLAFRLIFFLRLQHLVYSSKAIYTYVLPDHPLENYLAGDFALFTGTAGPNRKLVLYVPGNENKPSFIKIALNGNSSDLLMAENRNVTNMLEIEPNSFVVPKTELLGSDILVTEDVSMYKHRSNYFTGVHAAALGEIFSATLSMSRPDELLCLADADSYLAEINGSDSGKIPAALLEKLKTLRTTFGSNKLYTSTAHGDFTPWNTFYKENSLAIYDWELARQQIPAAYDVFHFVIQKGILTDHHPWKVIKAELKSAFDLFATESGLLKSSDFETYLKYYLYLNTAYSLHIYASQPEWHLQVNWLLNTWSEAISDMIKTEQNTRELVITGLFDYLRQVPYAAIKFPDSDPATLSEYADIDLSMNRSDALRVISYLKNHKLVKKAFVKKSSFMAHVMLVLDNGSLLAIDLIWQFRRKHLQFMELKQVLENARMNLFGVKMMSRADTAMYLRCFYGLNNSSIPEKYASLFSDYGADPMNVQAIRSEIKQAPCNRGISALRNRIRYVADALKNLVRNKGMIVTFSGVDGAGKSTVIELTRREVEKKFRKRVVVLRHRPSVLPILSAITLGKEKAEQNAAQTLPRKGGNKSAISSLLRFAYYYTDYFFGQFYIYARYVLRGDVVLYDRYYFDFINDSVRSNIRLPRWLLKSGYKLLLRPHLNFFLYADAETILSRKQELNADTIEQLTAAYLQLFGQLGKNGKKRYLPVKNITLDETVKFISSKLTMQLI